MTRQKGSALPPHLHMFPLTFAFFAAGTLFFLAAWLLGVRLVPRLVEAAAFPSSGGFLLAHLLLLGWATNIAMGASYQITQVLMRTSIYSRKLGIFHLIAYLTGVLVLLTGFTIPSPRGIAIGGGLVVLGVAAFAFNLGVTYKRSRTWTPVTAGAAASVLNLCATVMLGTAMGIAMWTGWLPTGYEMLVHTHMWFGLAGWLGGLIVSYSIKLLPMFYVSRKKATPRNYAIIVTFHAGVWLGGAGWWSGSAILTHIGLVLVTASLGMLTWFARDVRRQKSGKQPIGAVKVADGLIAVTFGLALTWTVLYGWSREIALSYPVVSTLVMYVILGWFSASILAYLSKIVPFLWWAYRFRTKEQKQEAPLLQDMVPHNRVTAELLVMLAGVGVVMAGNAASHAVAAATGLLVTTAAALSCLLELVRVFRH